MFLYRMSYSAVLFTVRSSSVCQHVGSANSMVICMFPWYILDWLSNLKPLTRVGKSCNGTCEVKSIFFIGKIGCAETICINCRSALWLMLSASGWPRWCCTCFDEKRSPPENLRVETWPPSYHHHSLMHHSWFIGFGKSGLKSIQINGLFSHKIVSIFLSRFSLQLNITVQCDLLSFKIIFGLNLMCWLFCKDSLTSFYCLCLSGIPETGCPFAKELPRRGEWFMMYFYWQAVFSRTAFPQCIL